MSKEMLNMKLNGAKEVARVLNQLPDELSAKVLNSALRSGTNIIKKEIIAKAPVSDEQSEKNKKYGHLKDNIRVSAVKKTKDRIELALHNRKAFWALFIEFGTSKTPARPFMRPALDANADKAIRKIVETLSKGLDKTAEKLAGKLNKSGLKTK